MLKITPVQDKFEQERFCSLCEAEYMPDALAYAGYDEDKFVCVAQFSIKGTGAELYSIAPVKGRDADEDTMYLCGRTILTFASDMGCGEVVCDMPDAELMPVYRRIGFVPDGGRLKADLRKPYCSHCG